MANQQTRKLVPSSGLVDVCVPSGRQMDGEEDKEAKGMNRTLRKGVACSVQVGSLPSSRWPFTHLSPWYPGEQHKFGKHYSEHDDQVHGGRRMVVGSGCVSLSLFQMRYSLDS
jgi:hypothetical protein